LKVRKNTSIYYYTFIPILGGIFQILSIQALTWTFSSDYIGLFYLLLIFTNFFLLVISFGLDQSLAREFHQYSNKLKLLIHTLVPGLLVFIIFGFTFFVLDSDFFASSLFSIQSSKLSALIFFSIFFEFVNRFLGLQMRMYDNALEYSLIQLIPKLLFLCLILFSFFLLDLDTTINILIFLHFLSVFLTFICACFFNYKTNKDYFFDYPDLKMLNGLFKFGLPFIFSGIAIWSMNSIDKVFLRSYDMFEELAILSVSASISLAATFIASIFNTIWMPLVYKWNARGVGPNVIEEVLDYAFIIILSMVLIIISFSWMLPFFFPPLYSDIQYLILGCVLGPFFYSLSEITGVGIALERKTNYFIFISFVAILTIIFSSFFLIPIHGAKGAITSVTLSYLAYFILRTYISMKVILGLKIFKIIMSAFLLFFIMTSFLFYGSLLTNISYLFIFIILIGYLLLKFKKLQKLYKVLNEVELFN